MLLIMVIIILIIDMEDIKKNEVYKKCCVINEYDDLDEINIFDITLRLDVTLEERENRYNIPRPIFENIEELLNSHVPSKLNVKEFIEYREENVPIFGSFGFGFNRKGFDKIIQLINNQYDNAIIKLVMPHAETCPSDENIINRCIGNITKAGIKLMVTHDFFDENDILLFLQSNTMNIFMYETHQSAGVSSVIDYALSVKIPIAISDASWFRHIYSDEICVYKRSIKDILNTSRSYCEQYLDIFSNDRLRNKVEIVIRK